MPQHLRARQEREQFQKVQRRPFEKMERAAKRVAGVIVHLGAQNEFSPVGLRHVDVQRRRDDYRIEKRLERLGDAGLQRVRFDRDFEPRHAADDAGVSCRGVDDRSRFDPAAIGYHGFDTSVAYFDRVDLSLLMDLAAAAIDTAGVGPDDRIVADNPSGRVVQRRHNRKPAMPEHVEIGDNLLNLVWKNDSRINPHHLVGEGPLGEPGHAPFVVGQRQVSVLREHDVEVEIGRKLFVEVDRFVVKSDPFGGPVVRAHDRRVAPRPAEADVFRFEYGDVANAHLRQVIGGRQAVHAAADDDDVIAVFEFVLPPHLRNRHLCFS